MGFAIRWTQIALESKGPTYRTPSRQTYSDIDIDHAWCSMDFAIQWTRFTSIAKGRLLVTRCLLTSPRNDILHAHGSMGFAIRWTRVTLVPKTRMCTTPRLATLSLKIILSIPRHDFARWHDFRHALRCAQKHGYLHNIRGSKLLNLHQAQHSSRSR